MKGLLKTGGAVAVTGIALAAIFLYEPTKSRQIGFDGVAMQVTDSEERIAARIAHNEVPPGSSLPDKGRLAVDAYKNVQVLGHLTAGEFVGLMNNLTAWVSPKEGCGYCHNPNDLAADDVYTKIVSRRMLQMTMYINENLKDHVADTGVTCYTCHRGQPVPRYIWHEEPNDPPSSLGNDADQNKPQNGQVTSFPRTYLEEFLYGDTPIRVQSLVPLPNENKSSIKQAEWTYGLMMHFSRSLGVNCTYCHNSRSWADWAQSPAPRATAWHGIRMVRHLNNEWLEPLTEVFPPERLGPNGDGPKLNCATCHQGAFKPLLGQSMLPGFPSLAAAKPQPAKSPVAGDGGADGAAAGAP